MIEDYRTKKRSTKALTIDSGLLNLFNRVVVLANKNNTTVCEEMVIKFLEENIEVVKLIAKSDGVIE